MRFSVVVGFAITVIVCACGDSRDGPAPKPTPEPIAATEAADDAEPPQPIGLTDEERERLKKEFAAEANARITAENAESVGRRMLAEVEQELAAELAAVGDAGTD